jgi:hypothetical protein
MVGPNGVALNVLARKRYVVNPEVIVFDLTIAGEDVTLNGYCKGPGCPVPIQIGVLEAWATWEEDRPTREETGYVDDDGKRVPGTLSPHRWVAKRNASEMGLRRDLLRESVPGLTVEQANLLASEGGPADDMLRDMRYFDAEPEAPTEESEQGEAVGEAAPSTGQADSPDSALPTRARTRSR